MCDAILRNVYESPKSIRMTLKVIPVEKKNETHNVSFQILRILWKLETSTVLCISQYDQNTSSTDEIV